MSALLSCSTISLIKPPSCSNSKKRRRKSQIPPPPRPQQRPPSTIDKSNHHRTPPTPRHLSLPGPVAAPATLTLTLTRAQALDHVLADLEVALARGVALDTSVFSSLLETCTQIRSLRHGERLHRLIPPALLRRNAGLSSKLVRLYASCGRMDEAHQVFDEMPARNKTDAFPWNSLIAGYAEADLHEDAMALYYQMEEDGVEPDEYTFPRVLKACAGIGSIRNGEAVHRHIVRSGFVGDIFVLNALVDMYSKCGDIQKARRVFDVMTNRDAVSWNSMLMGYIWHGLPQEAVDICRGMVRADVVLDSITVSAMLSSFSSRGKLGLQIHGWVLRRGLEWEPSIANSMITMYSEQGRLDLACLIFESLPDKDLVSWNAMIRAHRRDHQVLALFQRMEDAGEQPDEVTFVSLLSACANLGLVEDGRRLFADMERRFKVKPGVEHYGCMVNLLGRAGLVHEAYEVASKGMMLLDGAPAMWGSLLFACSLHGEVEIAEMAAERLFELEPDNEHNFELLMRIYRDKGRLEDVERVRGMMKARGLESAGAAVGRFRIPHNAQKN